MAMRSPYIKKGYVTYRDDIGKDLDGGFSLKKYIKHLLTYLGITFYDPCCDEENDFVPMRYNRDTNVIQYFNGTTWATATAGNPAPVSGDIRYDATSPSFLERYNGTSWIDIPAQA